MCVRLWHKLLKGTRKISDKAFCDQLAQNVEKMPGRTPCNEPGSSDMHQVTEFMINQHTASLPSWHRFTADSDKGFPVQQQNSLVVRNRHFGLQDNSHSSVCVGDGESHLQQAEQVGMYQPLELI